MDPEQKTPVANTEPKQPRTSHQPLKLALIVVIVAIVTVGLLLADLLVRNNNVQQAKSAAFIINGHIYSKPEIQSLIAYPLSVGDSKNQAVQIAFKLYEDEAVAQKLGIVVPASQLATQRQTLIKSLKNNPGSAAAKPWVDLVNYTNTLQNMILNGSSNPAQGYLFNFWFNQHDIYGPTGTPPAGNGDPTLVAQDRAYAQSQANNYHEQLVAKKITPVQLISKIDSDPKLNQLGVASPGASQSIQFGNLTVQPWQQQLNSNAAIIKYINDQKKTGVSQVLIGQLSVPATVAASGELDSYYYIVELDQLPQSPISYNQFQKTLMALPVTYHGL